MGNLLRLFRKDDDFKEETEDTGVLIEQYASQVLDFSTQYGSDRSFSYTAANCLGVPSKFPNYGDFPQTYVMRTFGKWKEKSPAGEISERLRGPKDEENPDFSEFIDLRFDHAVFVHGMFVYETLNPGSIVAIFAGDCKGSWKCLWTGEPIRIGHQPRQFAPPIELTSFPVVMVRICFDVCDLPYHAAIDAVCLLGTLQSPALAIGPILKMVLDQKLHLCLIGDNPSMPTRRISDNGCFDFLPREALLHIFRHLDFFSLVQCGRVSKLFRTVTSDPLLYLRLDLKRLFHLVSNGTLKYLLPRCSLLRYLDLSMCGNYGKITPVTLRTFLYARGSKLTNLILANCHIVTPTVLSAISRACHQLVDLDLSNCHIIDTGSFGVLALLKSLQQLNLYRTQISNSELKLLLTSNTGLLSLNIGACPRVSGDDICQHLAVNCPQLVALDLWRCLSVTARGIISLSSLTQLTDLDLGWCVNVLASTGCIQSLVAQCRQLRRLLLTAHRQTSDAEVVAISSHLGSSLRQFSCMGSRSVSSESLLLMAAHCPNLILLDISYCEHLETSSFQRDLCSLLPACHIVTSLNGS